MKSINNTTLAFITISISVLFQVHCAIHGFDLTDEGYLMSIYQWFGDNPYYAQGAGGYPLTGFLGWLIMSIYPQGGILGMRLCGILLVTISEILFYSYLKRYFNPKMILAGLLIQSIFVAQDPKPFGYNTLTVLFAGLSLICLLEGCIRNKRLLLFIGGTLLGLNVFIRIPNLSCLSFLIIPFVYNVKSIKDIQFKISFTEIIIILIGFVISSASTWIFLVNIGADSLVVDLLSSMGDTLGGKSTHGSSSLIAKYAENIILSIKYFFVFVIAVLIAAVNNRLKNKIVRLVVWFIVFQIIYRLTYMHTNVLGDTLLGMMNGLGIFGGCFYIFQSKEKRIIALSAILFSLVIPLGSDGGYQTMWVGTWFSLPIGLSGLYSLAEIAKTKQIHLNMGSFSIGSIHGEMKEHNLHISTPKFLHTAFYFCLITLLVAAIAKVENRAYYDPGHKSHKIFALKSSLAKGIYTSQERADIMNPLLENIGNYVKPGDTMLVYDSSPLIYYLTQTKPFAGISWPCVFYGEQYIHKFNAAEKIMEKLPVIVMQNFWSSNTWGKYERKYYDSSIDALFSTKEMIRNMMIFIRKYHYEIAWSNRYYHILLPSSKPTKQYSNEYLPSYIDMYSDI